MMDFVVKMQPEPDMMLSIDESFIIWLNRFESPNCTVEIDPYCDNLLYENAQSQLLAKIDDILRSFQNQRIQHYSSGGNLLPTDRTLREALLQQLIQKDLQANPNFVILQDVQALIEIALERDSLIYCFMD